MRALEFFVGKVIVVFGLIAIGSASNAATGDIAADRVLGQKNFAHAALNLTDARGINGAFDVAVDTSVSPNRIYAIDGENSRVLGWKDSAGFENGEPADLVIGQSNFFAPSAVPLFF